MSGSISRPKINCPGLAFNVLWYEHGTAYAIDVRIFLHGETALNVILVRYLVLSMIPMTGWILCKISFACWFFIAVSIRLIEEYLSNGIKFLLDSEPLSEITLRCLGYIDSHNSLNIWNIIAGDWSMIGTSAISKHPVAGSIKVAHNNWIPFVSILLSGYLTLASILYVPMRSTHTVFHGVKVSASLARINPYLELRFLNFWWSLQVLQSFRAS